jgi:hypothetical protein
MQINSQYADTHDGGLFGKRSRGRRHAHQEHGQQQWRQQMPAWFD